MLGADARSAVGGDGVIPARFVPQSVERMDVFKETFARVRWRNSRAVKIDVLLAVVCAHADHVALISHDASTTPKRRVTAPILRQNGLTNTSEAADAIARSPATNLFPLPNGASNHTAPNAQATAMTAVRRTSS